MLPQQTEVIIVSGLPRSGTSMMMRMLEAGGVCVLTDQLRSADEDNPNGYYEFEPVKRSRQDPSWLQGAAGKAVKMVYRLLYDLPSGYRYRVVFMRRNLEEVLASQRTMLQRHQAVDDVSEKEMAALFRSQLHKFEAWIAQQANFTMLEVNYNELLRDAQPQLQKLNAFFGGALNTAAMAGVVDASLYRNRQQAS